MKLSNRFRLLISRCALICTLLVAAALCVQAAFQLSSAHADIYVPNSNNNSITVYLMTDTGNAVPQRTISGANTGLTGPAGVAVSSGFLYVINFGGNNITVYNAMDTGNTAPQRTISGANTGLTGPAGVAVSSGFLYVTNNADHSITVYNITDTGNVLPQRTISGANTGLFSPYGVVVSSGFLYVINFMNHSITVYNATDNGNIAPLRTISGVNTGLNSPKRVAVSSGLLYVTNGSTNSITVYNAADNGNIAPLRTISGANTGLNNPDGVVVSSGLLYVTNSTNSITVYNAADNGNIAPLRTISGANTGLNAPAALLAVDEPSAAPSAGVTLNSVSSALPYTATATATGAGIGQRGFYWWIPPGPETHWGGSESGLLPAGYGAGSFSLNLTGLKPNTKYHLKAYINVGGQNITSDETVFTTSASGSTGGTGGGTTGSCAPKVVTGSCTVNPDNTVSAAGQITDVGCTPPVTTYGFVYAKHPAPYTGSYMYKTGDKALAMWDQAPAYQGISFDGTIRNLLPGTYYLRAYAHNDQPDSDEEQTASLAYGQDCTFTIACTDAAMCPKGDVNGDGKVDLADAILVLKILAGIPVADYINPFADVNGDKKIGMEELGYILQKAAGLR